MKNIQNQLEELCRGVVGLHVKQELEERIRSGKRLRVKAGFDPTRPDLHLGHTVLIQKMKHFQDFGHEVVFVIGDFTAMVGDPTGRNELRPKLTREEVLESAKTYQDQVFKILDREKTVLRYNSEWIDQLNPSELTDLCAKYTVARMLEREDFSQRYKDQRPIYIHEFLYPLLQGYDSVVLNCDVELGGTDQLFNLMVGRDIMPRFGLSPQIVMTMPLLEGTNAKCVDGKIVGAKMSKSSGNYIGISEDPLTMFQKIMLIDDQVIWRYFELLSSKSNEEVIRLKKDTLEGKEDVIKIKENFAIEMVTRFHSKEEASKAQQKRKQIAVGQELDDVEVISISSENKGIWIAKALALSKVCPSSSQAVRLVQGGAVHVDGEVVRNEKLIFEKGQTYLVRVGSKNRKIIKIAVE